MNEVNGDFANVLKRAASVGTASPLENRDLPSKDETIAALQAAEIQTRRARSAIPFESLIGEWNLRFATGASKDKRSGQVRLGRGYYVPKFISASIAFSRDGESNMGTVTNRLTVAGIQIKFTGPCRYPGKKNLLVFDFTELEFKILGAIVYRRKIRRGKTGDRDFSTITTTAKLPFFAFFWANKDSIAARGRTGGMALWVIDN